MAQVDVTRAQLQQAKSNIKEVDSEINKYKAEFERQQRLLPQGASSQKQVNYAKANYEVATEQRIKAVAALAQSRASLVQSEADLAEARANIGAPGRECQHPGFPGRCRAGGTGSRVHPSQGFGGRLCDQP